MNLVDLIGICGWCIRFDQRCMDICRGKNQQHTHFSLIYVTKVRRQPEYMWIRINSKKKKKSKTQNGLQCETIHFCFMNFIMSIVLMWIAIPLPVANWWCDIQEETNNKKNSKKPNDWDFNIQFRMWLFWISIIQHLKWHSQLTH